MRFIITQGRVFFMAALMAAVLMLGCGGDDGGGVWVDTNNPGNGGNGGSGETVALGGKTWMAKNLNIQTADSWCYGEGGPVYDAGHSGETITSSEVQANCAKYGRLYTWSAARSACPLAGTGWRLPTRADWDALAQAAGGRRYEDNWPDWHDWELAGRNLKSTSGWNWNDGDNASGNGTDTYGFSALPGGRCHGSHFGNAGLYGHWWAAEEYGSDDAYFRYVHYDDDGLYEYAFAKSLAYSVRCVRD